ncbi:MAG: tetratricopeptide repeat protein [Leptospiraceae bacterium]|nr:tetratricopeptide repeat protein [Leptospiraceae bacterium]
MINKQDFHRRIIVLAAGILLLMVVPDTLSANGRESFEAAYRIEKKNPERAMQLYQQALQGGLNTELRRAAMWRLFYLYQDLGYYDQAIRLAASLGVNPTRVKKVSGSLVENVGKKMNLDRERAGLYVNAMHQSRYPESSDCQITESEYTEALKAYPEHKALQSMLAKGALACKKGSVAIGAFRKCASRLCQFQLAELYYDTNQYSRGRTLMMGLALQSDLAAADRSRILYMLGKSWREQRDCGKATYYYRLAAQYADEERRERHNALAAYSLYSCGLKNQARALFRSNQAADDEMLRIFNLVLEADVDKDPQAKKELKDMRPRLLKMKQQGMATALVTDALRLARQEQ